MFLDEEENDKKNDEWILHIILFKNQSEGPILRTTIKM